MMSPRFALLFLLVLAAFFARPCHTSTTCTLSIAGVQQVTATLATLTSDVTALQTAVATLTTNLATLTTNVGTVQTTVSGIASATTAIGTTTVNTETTVNTIAADLTVNTDQIAFISAVVPVASSPMAAGYADGIYAWTSGVVQPWTGTINVLNFCSTNYADSIWLLDAADNTATTIDAFSQVITSIVRSLPTAANFNFLTKYNDACAGPGFTYGTLVGTCCIDPTNHDYVYNTASNQFTCSDQTTALFPLCVVTPTGATP